MTWTAFYEGDEVNFVGVGEPARGTLVSVASKDAAWVKWPKGSSRPELELVDLYDLAPVTAEAREVPPTRITVTSVRSVYAANGSDGVVDYLAASNQINDWPMIAEGALNFVISKLKSSTSMDLPYEQLNDAEVETVLRTAALRLLRDAVTPEEE